MRCVYRYDRLRNNNERCSNEKPVASAFFILFCVGEAGQTAWAEFQNKDKYNYTYHCNTF